MNHLSTAINMIEVERRRQIQEEGWTTEHDDQHSNGELADAAACYASSKNDTIIQLLWPWDFYWWKPNSENRIKDLVKAGALIVSEIERLQRKKMDDNHGNTTKMNEQEALILTPERLREIADMLEEGGQLRIIFSVDYKKSHIQIEAFEAVKEGLG